MADTTFVDQSAATPIVALWLNDVNIATYRALGSGGVAPTTAAQVLANLGISGSGGSGLVGYLPAGAGSVATTAQSKLRERVSVLDKGADPTGVADSTAAFTAIGSGEAHITAGTYLLNSNPTPAGTVTWILHAGATLTGVGVLPGYVIQYGGVNSPPGNASPTTIGLAVTGTTFKTAQREMLLVAGLTANKGNGQVSPAADKVAIFGGIDGANGTFNIWGLNTSTIIDAGNTTNQGAWGYELDLNNHSVSYGNTGGAAGLNAPSSFGMQITGNNDFNNTYAMGITNTTGAKWNRGLVMHGNVVIQADIESYTSAAKWASLFGTYAYGLDFINASITGAAVRMANLQPFVARNAAGSADVTIASVDASNNINLGASANRVQSLQTLRPANDNTQGCGENGFRWASVWAANGTIQTSDPSLKTDIAKLPSVLPLVNTLDPKTFRWVCGGSTIEEVEEEQEVHDVIIDEYDTPVIEIRNGVAVEVLKRVRIETPAYDEIPVVDLAGNPVMITVPAKPAIVQNGVEVFPAQAEQQYQKTHRKPRMVKKLVTVQKVVEKAGKRTHWGFLADEVKASFDTLGMDFGGYVKDSDGLQHLRPDQLIPVLWKAIQELSVEIEALKAVKTI